MLEDSELEFLSSPLATAAFSPFVVSNVSSCLRPRAEPPPLGDGRAAAPSSILDGVHGLVVSGVAAGIGLGRGVLVLDTQIPSISIPLSRARDPKGMRLRSFVPIFASSSAFFIFSAAPIFFILQLLYAWTHVPYTRTSA